MITPEQNVCTLSWNKLGIRLDDLNKAKPACTCHQWLHLEKYGTVRTVDGCIVLAPISVSDISGPSCGPAIHSL